MSTAQTLFPPAGRLLGVDYGSVRIGLAISDPQRLIASPFATYLRQRPAQEAVYFKELVERESIVGLVVGLPLHADGRESEKSQECRGFAQWLSGVTDRPVVLWDERFTSAAAERILIDAGLTRKQRKSRVDRLAAQMFLQSFIDAGCPPSSAQTDFNTASTRCSSS